jgi:hypothetical protein
MTPQSKWLYDLLSEHSLRSNPPTEDDVGMEPPSRDMPQHDPRYIGLVLRKKRQTQLLRKMLESGGYGDLAKMTSFHNVKIGQPPGEE